MAKPALKEGTEQRKLLLPPLETHKTIVAEIGVEQGLIAANRGVIVWFEAKIQATLARVWGEEPAPEAEGEELGAPRQRVTA
jgi:hypothetical protein